MKTKKILSLFTFTLLFAITLYSQEGGEVLIEYNLPYKNTYVKEALVAENEYRVATQENITPRSVEEARSILPSPFWVRVCISVSGHSIQRQYIHVGFSIYDDVRTIRIPLLSFSKNPG